MFLAVFMYRLSQNMFTRLAGIEMSRRQIFKIKMLIYQSKANLDKEILCGKITHHLDLEIWKMLVRGMFGKRIQHSILVQKFISEVTM